ncbi:MAG TPA: hypothetical protein H9825_01130 [Candidatus Sphingobacterium stercorigallinarum]|nr:hypothetical protein [Candidatus Sphingobacterium stercorigallinarum]
MKRAKQLLCVLLCLLCVSCSCLRVFSGMLLNPYTRQPIEGAQVEVINQGYERIFQSDSTGYFEAFIQGGSRCPRIQVHIRARGYLDVYATEPQQRDTVTLLLTPISK